MEVESVPLKALIAASNETPPPGQGLEALYDRFLIRLDVSPMEEKANFESLLKSQPTRAALEFPVDLKVKHEEWERWNRDIHEVKLSEETLNIIHDIRLSFVERGEELDVYVSDRRWQKAAILLKAAAFFSGRKETNLVDTLLLRHCLWTTKDNYSEVAKIVEGAVRNCGFETGVSLHIIDKEKWLWCMNWRFFRMGRLNKDRLLSRLGMTFLRKNLCLLFQGTCFGQPIVLPPFRQAPSPISPSLSSRVSGA